MTVDTLIILLGSFVALLPFLGVPNSVDKALFLLAGIFVISLGIVVRRKGLKGSDAPERSETPFVDALPRQSFEHERV